MSININQAKIDQAKLKQYNGRSLSDVEKTIFDGLDNLSVDKVEEVLGGVLKVRDATTVTFDSPLLTKLSDFAWKDNTTNERKAFEALNKDNNLGKETIKKLQAASTKPNAVDWAKARFTDAADKKIFEDSKLVTATEIYELARLLNYVNWVKTEKDATKKTLIKTKLEAAKTANSTAYQELKAKIDVAIEKLAGTYNQTDERVALQSRLVAEEKKISDFEKELVQLKAATKVKFDRQQQLSDRKFAEEVNRKKLRKRFIFWVGKLVENFLMEHQ